MNTIKTLILALVALVLIWFFASFALGIETVGFAMTFIFPTLLISVHMLCSVALYRETKLRMENRISMFLKLDPLFWGIVGITFGILGLLSYRLLNDHFTSKAGDGNSE